MPHSCPPNNNKLPNIILLIKYPSSVSLLPTPQQPCTTILYLLPVGFILPNR
uniref:Uncharacterized protein n=1 Tax=Picea glauca TaxID=3330 RepID=A0A101M4V4_PICGL|nr:hypothetical protein ABT39_MTgene859 [Picea glauca]QHR90845.1 hypothetical protein Q903MT_gene4871 [Picea sitchensis]